MSDASGTISPRTRGRREFRIAAVLLVFSVLLSGAIRLVALRESDQERPQINATSEIALQRTVHELFTTYRRAFLQTCTGIARSPELVSATSKDPGRPSPQVFDILNRHGAPGTTYEVYSRTAELVAWIGPGGIGMDEDSFADSIREAILQGPIFTYYSVILPITRGDSTFGYLAGRTIFSVRYPLSNRFISSTVFRSAFTAQVEGGEAIHVLPAGEIDTADGMSNVLLKGEDGKELATLVLPVPTTDESVEEKANLLLGIESVTWLCLILVVAWILYRRSGSVHSRLLRFLYVLSLIWLVRFSMLWLGVPSRFTAEGVFDPFYFASTFGYGLAQSAGEALISSLFLFMTMVIAAASTAGWDPPVGERRGIQRSLRIAIAIVVSLFEGAVLWTLLRGVAAMIRSAVVDTTLSYTDPTSLLPPPALCALLVSAFLVAAAFSIAGLILMLSSHRLIRESFGAGSNGWISGGWMVLFFAISAFFYGILHPNPLTDNAERIAVLLAFAATTFLLISLGIPRISLRTFWFIAAIAAAMVLIRFDRELKEFDRSSVELIAEEISGPVDSWLSFVVNRALDEMSTQATVDALFRGSQEDIDKLAFTSWARSILSREGLNCSVLVVDYDGTAVSEFRVGAGPIQAESQFESSTLERSVTVEEREGDGGRNVWYVGFVPLYSGSGTPMGGIRIEVSATRKVFLRGDAPEILRNYGREDRRSRERAVVFSEFSGGQIISTTSESIPMSKSLPDVVARTAANGGMWVEETEGGAEFETFYFRSNGSYPSSTVYALGLRTHDLQWRAYVALRILTIYVFIALAGLLFTAGIRHLRGAPIRMSFRSKILLTFVLVSIVPLAVMTIYNREYAVARAESLMIRVLSEETNRVVGILQRDYGVQTPFDLARLRDADCREIAEKATTDFNLYGVRELLASSRPEVFVSELIDRRLSGAAFRSVSLDRISFFSERQSIGMLEYVVGYRPLLSSAGAVIGVVSIHTLYRQQEVDNEAVSRNSFLFGAYAFSCLIALGLGLVFSRRISLPIKRLQLATRQIAAGDLDVAIRSHRTDELGELERAFDTMASDLKDNQERIVRTERELAWREMAKQVAHEIKNPLTPMQLSVQHLRRAYEDGAQDFGAILRQVTQVLLDQIGTLSRIATEFSRFARMPDRRPEPCEIHELLADASGLFAQHSGISLTTAFSTAPAIVVADREELRRAFVNILRNAVQAMNEKGSISISSERRGNAIAIEISDNGPGVTESMKGNLFKPNFSTKTDGMGLGLAIVKKTIDDLQGEIHIDSSPGKGTTVHISIPLTNPPMI